MANFFNNLLDKAGDALEQRVVPFFRNRRAKATEELFDLIAASPETMEEDFKKLTKRGITINAKNKDGQSPLMCAIQDVNLKAVQFCLEHGANVNEQDNDGKTAYTYAATLPLYAHRKIMLSVLPPNPRLIDLPDKDGMTACMHAAACGYTDAVVFLTGQGANFHATDKNGMTACLHAAEGGHEWAVRWLAEHGADIYKRNKEGKCTLNYITDRKLEQDIIALAEKYNEEHPKKQDVDEKAVANNLKETVESRAKSPKKETYEFNENVPTNLTISVGNKFDSGR